MTQRDNWPPADGNVIPLAFAQGRAGPLRMSAREAGAAVRALVAEMPPEEILVLYELLTSQASLRSLAAAANARRSP